MRLVAIVIFIPFLCFSTSHAQVLSGVVSDGKTKISLPYVHIGVLNKNMGVISDENGKFEIELKNAMPEDELIFSSVGYDMKKFKIKDIKEGIMNVGLSPGNTMMEEVVVRAKKKVKSEVLGRGRTSMVNTGNSNSGNYGFGGEWGLRVFTDGKKYLIDNVQFNLKFNTLDSVLYRINIYKVENDLPGEPFLNKELFVKSYRDQHWIVKNLMAENIDLTQDVIVTFEVVRLWYAKQNDNQLFFTHGAGYDRGKTYSRKSSQDQWSIDKMPPIAMFITATSY